MDVDLVILIYSWSIKNGASLTFMEKYRVVQPTCQN